MAEPMDISPERMDISPPHFFKTRTQKRGRRIKLKNAKEKKNANNKKTHTKKNMLALNEKKRKENRQAIFDSVRGKYNFIWISHGEIMSQSLQNVPFEKFPYKKLLQYGMPGAILATTDKNETIPQKICNKEYSYAQRAEPIKEYQSKYMENGETKTVIEHKPPEWISLPDYRFSVSEHDEKNQIKKSMGLWYCAYTTIERIFTYDDILKKTKNGVRMTMHDVHDIIFAFCKSKKIPTNTATVSIWACRVNCGNNKFPIYTKGGGPFKKLPEPMSSEEMVRFLNVCEMPPQKKPSKTKTRKNKKRTQPNSSKV